MDDNMAKKRKSDTMEQQIHVYVPDKEIETLDSKLEGRKRGAVVRRLVTDFNRGRIVIDWSHD